MIEAPFLDFLKNTLNLQVEETEDLNKKYRVTINSNLFVSITPVDSQNRPPQLFLQTTIALIPKLHTYEGLFSFLMMGNFLKQGTGSAKISINKEKTEIFLSMHLIASATETIMYETLEELINLREYWAMEVAQFTTSPAHDLND